MKRRTAMSEQEIWLDESRGSMLLASVMTVSFGVLLFLGMVTSTLSERVRTERTIQTARAIQLARSGIEYALWEINYGGNDFTAPWTADGANRWRCLPITAACPGGGAINVLVDKDPDLDGDLAVGNWAITSRGLNLGVARTVTVSLPVGGAVADTETFDNQILYADLGYIHLDARSGEILLDGYDSNAGEYNPGDPLPAGSVEIVTDHVPFRHQDWNNPTHKGLPDDAPVTLEGNVTAKINIRIRTPSSGDLPVVAPMTYIEDVTGFADKTSDTTGPGGLPDSIPDGFKGTLVQEARTTSLGFNMQVKEAPLAVQINDPATADIIHPGIYFGTGFDPSAGDVMVICPGEQVKSTEVTVEDATLVIGCSSDPASPYYCDRSFLPGQERFKDFYGTPKSCAGANPEDKVIIGTRPTINPDYPDEGQYALWVRNGPLAGNGQILVLSPTEIYYDYKGAQGGFNIGGDGIRNQHKRANNAIDPNAVAIFGGKDSQVSSNYISTSEAFYGKIFNPHADVIFTNTGTLDFHGAINARGITTSSTVKIHWDQSFKYPTGDGTPIVNACNLGQPTCRPVAGSWQLLVN